MKELHIWLRWPAHAEIPTDSTLYLDGAEQLLHDGTERVDTVQAHCCNTAWLSAGYRLMLHLSDGTNVEVKLGENESTGRYIRVKHNLEKLLIAGEFGPVSG